MTPAQVVQLLLFMLAAVFGVVEAFRPTGRFGWLAVACVGAGLSVPLWVAA